VVAPSGPEQRKVVTVLFCDVVGSTALGETTDTEALRALLARYFERMREAVERHGAPSSNSSAMRSWPCSASRSFTRTTPSGPCRASFGH
jgi:hypothetical protein